MNTSFLHGCVTSTGIIESVCSQCEIAIAYSPDSRMLEIAESAHRCDRLRNPTVYPDLLAGDDF